MTNAKVSKLSLAVLLLGAGAAQAAAPMSVSEVPGAWYADRIAVSADARGATNPVFPAAAYEHGFTVPLRTEHTRARPSVAGSATPFPASPNESGSVL